MSVYSQAMGSTLAERVAYIQQEEQNNGHALRCLEELSIARETITPLLRTYAAFADQPLDLKQSAILIELGATVRSALHEIMQMAQKASRLEQDIKMLHDPRLTMMFIKNLVETLEREAIAEEDRTEAFDAKSFVKRVNDRVTDLNRFAADEVSVAIKSPSQLCLEMDASIGAA